MSQSAAPEMSVDQARGLCAQYSRALISLVSLQAAKKARRPTYLEVANRFADRQSQMPPGVLVEEINPELAAMMKEKLEEERKASAEIERSHNQLIELRKEALTALGAAYGSQFRNAAYLYAHMDIPVCNCIDELWIQANRDRKNRLDGISISMNPVDPDGPMINAFVAAAGFPNVNTMLSTIEKSQILVRDLLSLRNAVGIGLFSEVERASRNKLAFTMDSCNFASVKRLVAAGLAEPCVDNTGYRATRTGCEMVGLTPKETARAMGNQPKKRTPSKR